MSESGIVGQSQGRAFVAFVNLNAANNYKVTIHGERSRGSGVPRFRSSGVQWPASPKRGPSREGWLFVISFASAN